MNWRPWRSLDAARNSPHRGTVFYLPSFGLFTVDHSDICTGMVYDANGRSADWHDLLRDGAVFSLPLHLVEQEADRAVEALRREIRTLESKVFALEDEVVNLEDEVARLRS